MQTLPFPVLSNNFYEHFGSNYVTLCLTVVRLHAINFMHFFWNTL